MEYRFRLGSFVFLSLAEIINVLESENLEYNILDISLEYLLWASHQKFDQDLLFSIRTELKKRKRGSQFGQSTSPFANL